MVVSGTDHGSIHSTGEDLTSGDEYTFVEISGHWDDEKFRKVASYSETPSIEEYQRLRAEAVPMQDKEQMNGFNAATNATCVVAGMQFEIPSYWTAYDTEEEDVACYSIVDGEPGTMMIIEHFEENQTLTNSSTVDCAYYIKRLINSDGVSWLSSCENVSDQVTKAVGTTVMSVAETDYDEEFGFAFRINEGTNDVYLVEVFQPLDTEKGYVDDVVRIAQSGTPVQGEADTENTTESATTADSTSGLDLEFKKAMDSYEAFFDKYVEFMNTFSTSNNTVEMLTEYAEFMTQYADTMQKLDAIDESQLTPEEDAYYIQVMARINAKLAQAVQ